MPALLAACLVTLTGASTFAAGPVLRAGLGYSHMLETGDPVLDPVHYSGGGLDLYGGWQLDFGLTPELQVGFHLLGGDRRAQGYDLDTLWTVTPVLAGARYSVAPIDRLRTHVAAHAGLVHQYWRRELLGVRGSGSGNYAGFNVALGGDFLLDDRLRVGGAVTYWLILSKTDEVEDSGNGHMLSVSVQAIFEL